MSNVTAVLSHFSTSNEGFQTTIPTPVTAGAITVPLASTTGLVNGTIFVGIIEPTTVKQQVFTGTVDIAGTMITGVVWTRGTNVDHAAGVTIVDYVTGTDHNMATKGILVQHTQTGAHGAVVAASVSTPSLTVSSSVSMPNSSVFVVPANLFAGTGTSWTWQDWTPTYSGMTVGNGTVLARYCQIGKTVVGTWQWTLGTTSNIAAGIVISLPVTPKTTVSTFQPIGSCQMVLPSIVSWGGVRISGASNMIFEALASSGAYVSTAQVGLGVPGAWSATSSNSIGSYFMYEAA